MMPPAAITGSLALRGDEPCQRERAQPFVERFWIEHAAMSARLDALRDNRVDSRFDDNRCFVQGWSPTASNLIPASFSAAMTSCDGRPK